MSCRTVALHSDSDCSSALALVRRMRSAFVSIGESEFVGLCGVDMIAVESVAS